MPPDFVLGCERSGSTWLANVLDAHARCEVYLEPFADYAGILPGLPGRGEPLEAPSAAQLHAVRAGFARLPDLKHPWLYRPGRAPAWRRLDHLLGAAVAGVARLRGVPPPLSLQRQRLLDLHGARTPGALRTRKQTQDRVVVVKELRLCLQAALVRGAFPDARCLVVVRDPGAQIASVRRLFARGHLGELRRALPRLAASLVAAERLRRYRPLAEHLCGDVASPEALLAWWLVSYDVLLADCRRLGIPHHVMYHEALARDPDREAGAALAFLGLDLSPEALRYLRASSSRDVDPDAPLSTFRDAATHSERTRGAVSPAVRRCARAMIEKYAESEALRRYATAAP